MQQFLEAAIVVLLFTLFMPLLAAAIASIIQEFWPR
jgi:hypothetical protein